MNSLCLFCQIIQGAEPAYAVGENDVALAFLDRRPVNPGHALVIPKVHSKDILEMDESSSAGVFALVHQVSRRLQRAFGDELALNILMSNGAAAAQSVFHSHVHVIPRRNGDGFAIVEDPKPVPAAEQFRRVQALLAD